MLELKPILSALWRHKVSALLIVIQLGLTLAIVSNSIVVIQERLEQITRPTGMAVEDISAFNLMPIAKDYNRREAFRLDMDMIRSIPGVTSATVSNHVPLTGSGSYNNFYIKPNQETGAFSAGFFTVDEHFLASFGMNLIAGRTFRADEIVELSLTFQNRPSKIMVTKQFADELFPDGSGLGASVYVNGESQPVEIIGIVERNLGSMPNDSRAGYTVFYPGQLDPWHFYVVRAEPGQRDDIMKRVEEKLIERDAMRVINGFALEKRVNEYYAGDNTLVKVLSSVIALLTFIVALGIVGLTVFWITQRQKQIGIRRALGATRTAISRYFLIENIIIATTGIAFGMAAAQIFNQFLVTEFAHPVLPLSITIYCALALAFTSLAAAVFPALRAANISPATATRSV